jgi:hypothetical protein
MRPKVLVPLALFVCACSNQSGRSDAARSPDSGAAVAADPPAAVTPAVFEPATAPKEPPSVPGSQLHCGVGNAIVLKDSGIGDLVIGRTVGVVKRSCNVVRDASELGTEGTAERILTVVLGGATVRAMVDGELIMRIAVDVPRFATPDGLRVGSSMTRLVSEKGVKPAEGEDGLYLVLPAHCGLSFRFSIPSRAPNGQQWTPEQLGRIRGNTTVGRILVTKCVK